MGFVTLACLLTFIHVVWFQTNAIVEYTRKIPFLKKWFKTEEYHVNEPGTPYVNYLEDQYGDKFVVKLITCPICLHTWTTLIASLAFTGIGTFPSLFVFSLVLYLVIAKLL